MHFSADKGMACMETGMEHSMDHGGMGAWGLLNMGTCG